RALRAGDLDRAPVAPAERLLLEFVGTLTMHAYRITDEQVQGLRDAGWNDAQIAEAVYVGALFNLFVRLADAFDIHPPAIMDADGWDRTVAPEWSVIHIDGNSLTRAQALQMCRAKEPPIQELTVDDVAVRSYGDTAVVTGRTLVRVGGASPATLRLRFTDVFV